MVMKDHQNTTSTVAINPALLLLCICLFISGASAALQEPTMKNADTEPNPPLWPESVKIIRESDPIDEILRTLEETQDSWSEDHQTFTCDHHFSTRRFALLFAPGIYRGIDVEIGYYVQIAGLGRTPDQVKFLDCDRGPYVPSLNRHLSSHGTSLDTFWRSGENFASHARNGMQWAVSQAAPLRRVHVVGDLHLHDEAAYASGGHLANAKVDGQTHAGGQQQFLIRNVELGEGASGGAWSIVYVGCSGSVPLPSSGDGTSPSITIVDKPRVRIEKPYIALKEDGITFELRVPEPLKNSFLGPLFDGSHEESRDFASVRIVRADESSTRIQEALDQGKDVVLAPGIFQLNRTVEIRHPNQVLLGLGLATLVAPANGTPCLKVPSGIAGVRVAGIMLEASENPGGKERRAGSLSTLLEWGEEGITDTGSEDNPGALFDVFCRVGGSSAGSSGGSRESVKIDTMMRIHSSHVIGDNLWLWRADHGELARNEEANYPHISPIFWQTEQHEYRVETGIEVFGDDVTMFGLAVEHANGHQTVWSGERGAVHFYQCEFPYGVDREFGENGYRGYLVTNDVKKHEVYGPGIYSNFRNDNVTVDTAIVHPNKESVVFKNAFSVKLDNKGGIKSVVNGEGGQAYVQGRPART